MSSTLEKADRLLLEVKLKPIQGDRFQPTGFPDLGAAEISLSDDTTSLLVESAQSMANRLEEICLNADRDDFVDELKGLPMIKVNDKEKKQITNSVRESHRAGSYYIFDGGDDTIEKKFGVLDKGGDIWDTSISSAAKLLFKLDINALIHGVWIAKKQIAGGRIRISRALSAFIEANDAKSVTSGGTKIDHVKPGKDEVGDGAEKGKGNVPFPRVEYTARSITLYFNLDLRQIRSYGLEECQTELLIDLALWKIRKFLESGMRLRTACDLQIKDEPNTTHPEGFTLPDMSKLDAKIKESISKCKEHLPGSTTVTYNPKK